MSLLGKSFHSGEYGSYSIFSDLDALQLENNSTHGSTAYSPTASKSITNVEISTGASVKKSSNAGKPRFGRRSNRNSSLVDQHPSPVTRRGPQRPTQVVGSDATRRPNHTADVKFPPIQSAQKAPAGTSSGSAAKSVPLPSGTKSKVSPSPLKPKPPLKPNGNMLAETGDSGSGDEPAQVAGGRVKNMALKFEKALAQGGNFSLRRPTSKSGHATNTRASSKRTNSTARREQVADGDGMESLQPMPKVTKEADRVVVRRGPSRNSSVDATYSHEMATYTISPSALSGACPEATSTADVKADERSPTSRRQVMNATNTRYTRFSATNLTVDLPPYSATRRVQLEEWQDVPVFFSDRRKIAARAHAIPAAYQRFSFNLLGDAPSQLGGESVELNYALHNVYALMHNHKRAPRPDYPSRLPIELREPARRRRPRTPLSFFGPVRPRVGHEWFRSALSDARYVDTPNIEELERLDMAQKGRQAHGAGCAPVKGVDLVALNNAEKQVAQ